MKKLKNNYIVQAWLVLLLAIIFGSALAGVQLLLAPRILANKTNETLEKIPQLIAGPVLKKDQVALPKLAITPRTIAVNKNGRTVRYQVYQAARDGETQGWVIKSAGQGYADRIELLVGLDPLVQSITGLFILDQKETPGLGNRVSEPAWRGQFQNKPATRPLVAVKGKAAAPNEINAVTGATISSRSVCAIVNTALADVKDNLRQTEAKGKP